MLCGVQPVPTVDSTQQPHGIHQTGMVQENPHQQPQQSLGQVPQHTIVQENNVGQQSWAAQQPTIVNSSIPQSSAYAPSSYSSMQTAQTSVSTPYSTSASGPPVSIKDVEYPDMDFPPTPPASTPQPITSHYSRHYLPPITSSVHNNSTYSNSSQSTSMPQYSMATALPTQVNIYNKDCVKFTKNSASTSSSNGMRTAKSNPDIAKKERLPYDTHPVSQTPPPLSQHKTTTHKHETNSQVRF